MYLSLKVYLLADKKSVGNGQVVHVHKTYIKSFALLVSPSTICYIKTF